MTSANSSVPEPAEPIIHTEPTLNTEPTVNAEQPPDSTPTISKEPRMGTAVWGAILVVCGVLITVAGTTVPLDLTVVAAATLGGLGLLFLVLSLRRTK